jgi:hypothetical protein
MSYTKVYVPSTKIGPKKGANYLNRFLWYFGLRFRIQRFHRPETYFVSRLYLSRFDRRDLLNAEAGEANLSFPRRPFRSKKKEKKKEKKKKKNVRKKKKEKKKEKREKRKEKREKNAVFSRKKKTERFYNFGRCTAVALNLKY